MVFPFGVQLRGAIESTSIHHLGKKNLSLTRLFFSFNQIAEDSMNVQLKDITVTARDGRVSHLDQVYIRGSHVRFFIVPDMLRYGYYIEKSPNSPAV